MLDALAQAARRLSLGRVILPEECWVGIPRQQQEVVVWLRGPGLVLDVTERQATTSSDPFLVCILIDDPVVLAAKRGAPLTLDFCERNGRQQLLGSIELELVETSLVDGRLLGFFAPRRVSNFCISVLRLAIERSLQARSVAKTNRSLTGSMKMSLLHWRAAQVSFIRPHPTVLVTVMSDTGGNIFPMNIMGQLDHDLFGFALRNDRRAGALIEASRQLVLSDVPWDRSPILRPLAVNHTKDFVDWSLLPFATRPSKQFAYPCPAFATRVREMAVHRVRRFESHTFFIARIVSDELFDDVLCPAVSHSYYQYWKARGDEGMLLHLKTEDRKHKQGTCAA